MPENISPPVHAVKQEKDLPVKMQDGTVLYADVYRPNSAGEFPVLIERTPYDKSNSSETRFGAGDYYASRGYVAVFQDVRGRYASEGDFYPFRDDGGGEHRDGHDTVEWAAEQPWSNGRIGTIGGSYSGATQYRMHADPPPSLLAQFVRQSSADYSNEWVYRNGVFELGFNMSWATRHTASHARIWAMGSEADRYEKLLNAAEADLPAEFRKLPLLRDDALSALAPWWQDWLENPGAGKYWQQFNISPHHEKTPVPVYHLGGWYDGFLRGSLDNFSGMRKHGASSHARDNQRLTVGPWVHAPDAADTTSCGETDFGAAAAIGFFETRLRWFDHWLKGIDTGLLESPPVKLFSMGVNRWREFADWPPPGATQTALYLSGETAGACRSLNDGSLSAEEPSRTSHNTFEYDPMDPVPTLGGSHLGSAENGVPNGPMDQRPIHSRVLTYTGPVLEREMDVTGEVRAVIYADSSAQDTDFVVKLVDIHPDGRAMLVCDGVVRARYRNSRERPSPLTGIVDRYEIDLWGTSHVFLRGHRLQVIVTSSDFPRWDRNMNTGGVNARESTGIVARNTVHTGAEHPSHLLLPVMV